MISTMKWLLVAASLLTLSACRDTDNGNASAWLTQSHSVHKIELPAGEETVAFGIENKTIIAADTVHRTVWYMSRHGHLSRHQTGTSDVDIDISLPSRRWHSSSNRLLEVDTDDDGAWTVYAGKLSHISSTGSIIASINTNAVDIQHDPQRHLLWVAEPGRIVAFNAQLQPVYQYNLSTHGRNRQSPQSLAVSPDNGHVYIQLRREQLHLDAQAGLLGSKPSRSQHSITASRDGSYYTARGHYVTRYDQHGTVLQIYRMPDRSSVVDMQAEWDTGKLWILSRRALFTLDDGYQLLQVHPAPEDEHHSRRRNGRQRTDYRQLSIMGVMPGSPSIEIIEPAEDQLIPQLASISFTRQSVWGMAAAEDFNILVNGDVTDADCQLDQSVYSCVVNLDINNFSPQFQIRYVNSLAEETSSNVVSAVLDANGNDVADAEDDDDGDGLANQLELELGTDRALADTGW